MKDKTLEKKLKLKLRDAGKATDAEYEVAFISLDNRRSNGATFVYEGDALEYAKMLLSREKYEPGDRVVFWETWKIIQEFTVEDVEK